MGNTLTVRWTALTAGALVLVAIGATVAYVAMELGSGSGYSASPITGPSDPSSRLSTAPDASAGVAGGPLPEGVVQLTDEAVARAGIEVTVVGTATTGASIRIPATVAPNAYRSVTVTPVVGGRVTRMMADLGQGVRRGQAVAEIYSPELVEAQTRYLSMRAELEAHEQELRRTEKLAEIGAASRQELQRIHAEHTAATTNVESLRARLRLLGLSETTVSALSPATVTATVSIVAPIDGVVTARAANAGLNVEGTLPLVTIVDLSNVWIVGDLFERDFAAVRIGSPAIVTTTAYPELKLAGKVSYIDPQLKSETRTAQIRVEVDNPRGALRFGMYAAVHIDGVGGATVAVVPGSAVQTVGDRSVVYLVDPGQNGRFTEREVQLGETVNGDVQVVSGVRAGDTVVSKGSFSVRAERERRGLRPAGASEHQPSTDR